MIELYIAIANYGKFQSHSYRQSLFITVGDCHNLLPGPVASCTYMSRLFVVLNRPFSHKDFGCPEACLMAAPSGCSVFQLYLNSRK